MADASTLAGYRVPKGFPSAGYRVPKGSPSLGCRRCPVSIWLSILRGPPRLGGRCPPRPASPGRLGGFAASGSRPSPLAPGSLASLGAPLAPLARLPRAPLRVARPLACRACGASGGGRFASRPAGGGLCPPSVAAGLPRPCGRSAPPAPPAGRPVSRLAPSCPRGLRQGVWSLCEFRACARCRVPVGGLSHSHRRAVAFSSAGCRFSIGGLCDACRSGCGRWPLPCAQPTQPSL